MAFGSFAITDNLDISKYQNKANDDNAGFINFKFSALGVHGI